MDTGKQFILSMVVIVVLVGLALKLWEALRSHGKKIKKLEEELEFTKHSLHSWIEIIEKHEERLKAMDGIESY